MLHQNFSLELALDVLEMHVLVLSHNHALCPNRQDLQQAQIQWGFVAQCSVNNLSFELAPGSTIAAPSYS
jgi:hypothetical protein